MGITISFASEKGGIGKTTMATNIADTLSRKGFKVLIVDVDPQCNTTSFFKGTSTNVATMYDILGKQISDVNEAIQHGEKLDIIPCDPLLVNNESNFCKLEDYYILKKALKPVKENYDFIIIDTPPNLGSYLTNALVASDGVILPMMPQKFAIDGATTLMQHIRNIQEVANENLKIYGIAFINYDARKSLDNAIKDMLPEVAQNINTNIFKTYIRTCQQIQDAQAKNISIYDLPNNKAQEDFSQITEELLKIIGR